MASSRSSLLHAFLHPANLLWLGAAGMSSAVTGEPTTALLAAGVEGLYLAGMGIAQAVRGPRVGAAQRDAEERMTLALSELSPSQRQQAEALRVLRLKILENYRKLPGGKVLAASSEARLDSLLGSFVRLLGSLNSYRAHLGTAPRKSVETELAELEQDLAGEGNPRLREVKAKRVEILQKRLSRFQQAEESREVVSHQLAAIEDLLRLTHEQSISIRDPESAAQQLDALAAGVETSEETVREMERIMDVGGEELYSVMVPPERVR